MFVWVACSHTDSPLHVFLHDGMLATDAHHIMSCYSIQTSHSAQLPHEICSSQRHQQYVDRVHSIEFSPCIQHLSERSINA